MFGGGGMWLILMFPLPLTLSTISVSMLWFDETLIESPNLVYWSRFTSSQWTVSSENVFSDFSVASVADGYGQYTVLQFLCHIWRMWRVVEWCNGLSDEIVLVLLFHATVNYQSSLISSTLHFFTVVVSHQSWLSFSFVLMNIIGLCRICNHGQEFSSILGTVNMKWKWQAWFGTHNVHIKNGGALHAIVTLCSILMNSLATL